MQTLNHYLTLHDFYLARARCKVDTQQTRMVEPNYLAPCTPCISSVQGTSARINTGKTNLVHLAPPTGAPCGVQGTPAGCTGVIISAPDTAAIINA